MSDKPHVANDMIAPRIDDPEFLHAEARRMAKFLITDVSRADEPGQYIGTAIRDAAREHRVAASILQQAWNRPARDWKVSRWMALFAAYHRARERRAQRAYESKREQAEAAGVHPTLLRLADFVSGHADDEGGTTDPADRSRR